MSHLSLPQFIATMHPTDRAILFAIAAGLDEAKGGVVKGQFTSQVSIMDTDALLRGEG